MGPGSPATLSDLDTDWGDTDPLDWGRWRSLSYNKEGLQLTHGYNRQIMLTDRKMYYTHNPEQANLKSNISK